jgi:NTP-dependent ternary system trypsin peptidase co-occuring protein
VARTELVAVELGDGTITHVMAAVTGPGGDASTSRSASKLSDVTDGVTQAARVLIHALRKSFDEEPSRFVAELGLGFALQSGKLISFLADARAESSINVTVEWDRSMAPSGGSD